MRRDGATARAAAAPRPDDRALQSRLRRLEGQAHGIAEMVANERDALEVLQQFSAMIAASREAALMYARIRLRDTVAAKLDDESTVDDLVMQLDRLLRRASRLP